jgi:hypothetical protein
MSVSLSVRKLQILGISQLLDYKTNQKISTTKNLLTKIVFDQKISLTKKYVTNKISPPKKSPPPINLPHLKKSSLPKTSPQPKTFT